MWDWELLKNGSGQHHYEILAQYGNEDFQYTHAVSYGTQDDEFCLHNHSMYELVYCIAGDVVYLAEGVRYKLAPKSLLIINPAVPHKLFICSDAPFERHILYIYYAGSSSALSSLIAQCQRPIGDKRVGSAYFDSPEAANLSYVLNKISQVSRSTDEHIRKLPPYFAQSFASELLMITREKDPTQFSVGTGKTIDTLLVYLAQNFTKNLSLSDIADRFYLSKDYCNRIFRKATGMTVMQYITYSRVLYAKTLLADGVPAAEVAKQAGFSDYSNFYRAYRKITGRMPSEDHSIGGDMLDMPEPPGGDSEQAE